MLHRGDTLTFTIQDGCKGEGGRVTVNYDDFVKDVAVGDVVLIDGGIMSLRVTQVTDKDVT